MSKGGVMMIKWKEEYKIGVEQIDNQHKRLFEIADEAYGILLDKYSIDKYDRIVEVINELKDYTVFHFRSEEDYMKKINYPGLSSQKKVHDEFIEKINSVDLEQIDENQDKYIMEILDFVLNWIEQHILKMDKLIVSK